MLLMARVSCSRLPEGDTEGDCDAEGEGEAGGSSMNDSSLMTWLKDRLRRSSWWCWKMDWMEGALICLHCSHRESGASQPDCYSITTQTVERESG